MSGKNNFDKIDARRELHRRRLKQRQDTSRSKLRRNLLFTLLFILFILGRRGGDNLSKYSANNVGSSRVKDKNGSHSNYTTVLKTQTNDTTAAFLSKLMIKEHLLNATQSSSIDTHIKFIPYPHKTLGSGNAMKCNWTTIPLNDTNNTYDYDFTQQKAFSEGVCIPQNISIHIFSSNEAKECLSSKRIIIAGDSYNKQLFIGLADILLSKHIQNGKEILDGTYRKTVTALTNSVLAKRYKNDPSFPNVQYKCESKCYGNKATGEFDDTCPECINSYTKDDNTVAVVGAGIHLPGGIVGVKDRVRMISTFLDRSNRTIYVPMPHSLVEMVPPKYHDSAPSKNAMKEEVYNALLPNLAPQNIQHPFLDIYQLTRSCTFSNCTFDGGHKSRYVNRMKAQLLLNTLCEYSIR